MIRETPRRVEEFLNAEAEDVTNDIVLSFGTSPSRPGQPPGVDTGALRLSMRWDSVGRFVRHIMDGVLYGIFLEWGTTKMAPRPFMSPAFERKRKNFADHARRFGLIR